MGELGEFRECTHGYVYAKPAGKNFIIPQENTTEAALTMASTYSFDNLVELKHFRESFVNIGYSHNRLSGISAK